MLNADFRLNKEESDKLKYEINQINTEIEQEMSLYQELYGLVKDKFETIIQSRDNLFFEKRALTKFMKQCFTCSPTSINLQILEEQFTSFYNSKNDEKGVIEKFCAAFLKEKATFKESQFKLFEVATFIHE